nr:hypothetical protein CQW23_19884 [Ipomoea trifida]
MVDPEVSAHIRKLSFPTPGGGGSMGHLSTGGCTFRERGEDELHSVAAGYRVIGNTASFRNRIKTRFTKVSGSAVPRGRVVPWIGIEQPIRLPYAAFRTSRSPSRQATQAGDYTSTGRGAPYQKSKAQSYSKEEFDPGSEGTLAICLTHASRTLFSGSWHKEKRLLAKGSLSRPGATLGLRHGPDSHGGQQWGILDNGRKPDPAISQSVVKEWLLFQSSAVSISVVQIAAAWLFPGGRVSGMESASLAL